MMEDDKKIFIKDLRKQISVHNCFVIMDKEIRVSKNGKKYIEMTLGDKTGTMVARKFGSFNDTKEGANLEIQELFGKIELGIVHKISGKIEEFPENSGKFNMVVMKIQKTKNFNIEDYQPEAQTNRNLNIKYVKDQVSFMKDEVFKNLVCCFMESEYWENFTTSPAAMRHHHNYNSGNLEHSVNVMKICNTMNHCYKDLNKDLLSTGALLHDMGKIKTYTLDKTMVTMTPEGETFGHLYLSSKLLEDLFLRYHAMNGEPFPQEHKDALMHLILSHHGDVTNGWGSVVNPNTPEAIVLHYADLLDSRAKGKLQEQ
ncbi:MAG: hypothetical protein CVV28_02410 [Methanobacteriales archaeon HGW-Methanobacteriales-1]|jgi:3'-5' exoribonuclease|nr:MAG: hypothetical protein CVV28_02410 [Methanobacteriales archaeon HGW-Methanobacteriales-1]